MNFSVKLKIKVNFTKNNQIEMSKLGTFENIIKKKYMV